MKISSKTIEAFLREADIEGYIDLGAPADEYSSEAEIIASAVSQLEHFEINEENIISIIFAVWKKSFNLDNSDLQARKPAISSVTERIIKYYTATSV